MTRLLGTIFVVDDDPSIGPALRRLLYPWGWKVHVRSNTRGLFAQGRPDTPCCLILDVALPDLDGLTYQQRLLSDGIRVPIIFITGRGDIPTSVRAIKAGAVDFLPKPFDAAELLTCVRSALETDAQLLRMDHHLAEIRQRFAALTPREREVFAAVTSGMLNKQVGHELGIAEKTIKVHRARVMEKMGAKSLADLVRMADLLFSKFVTPVSTPAAPAFAPASI